MVFTLLLHAPWSRWWTNTKAHIFYTFMQHLGSWIKFLLCLGIHTDLCLYGKWLTTAANPSCIVSGYFSSYSMNKRMLTTLPPPPCPPCSQVIFPKSHAKVLSHYCACCWCLSHLGALLLLPCSVAQLSWYCSIPGHCAWAAQWGRCRALDVLQDGTQGRGLSPLCSLTWKKEWKALF